MADSEQKTKLSHKSKSRAKEAAEETAISPGTDILSAPTERQVEEAGAVKVEKKVGESKGSRRRKQKNEEQRVEVLAETPQGDLAPSQPVPITSQPTIGAPSEVARVPSQKEGASIVTPPPAIVEHEAVNSVKIDKENPSIRERIRQGLLKWVAWVVQGCVATFIGILFGFSQFPSHIPILDFIERQKLPVLIVLCVVVFLTLGGLLVFLTLDKLRRQQLQSSHGALKGLLVFLTLDKLRRPMDARLKAMGAVTSVSALSCLLCLSLLGITLGRPSWCPTALCAAPRVVTKPITTTQGSHDANLDVYFVSFESTAFVIPGDPARPAYIPSSEDPRSIGVVVPDAPKAATPYTIAIGLHSLYTGRYSIFIDKVSLLVTDVSRVFDPLHVYAPVVLTTYSSTNPSLFVYQGQQAGQVIADTYSTNPLPRVELRSGESDQIDAAIEARIPGDVQFIIQVTYHIATEQQRFTLTLNHTFEAVFAPALNWQKYQLNVAQNDFTLVPGK